MDHDHAKQAAGIPVRDTVRGILCSTCNRYLGHIGDDPAVGIRLAMYLIDPPAPGVLRDLAVGGIPALITAMCPDMSLLRSGVDK